MTPQSSRAERDEILRNCRAAAALYFDPDVALALLLSAARESKMNISALLQCISNDIPADELTRLVALSKTFRGPGDAE